MYNVAERLHQLVDEALREDVGDGDHSTLCCIPPDRRGTAVLKIKQEGVIAGIEVAAAIFAQKDPACRFTRIKSDGDTMVPGEKAFEVQASVHTILKCERLVLNCMQRMSGIATLTRRYVNAIAGYRSQILDTRKTTPNFRLCEKEAVRIGGAVNHRFGLFDMIMLKDNHIDYCGGLELAIERAWEYVQAVRPGLRIEVETRNLADVLVVTGAGRGKVSRILLDNFSPAQIREALELTGGDFETEASGGITLDNIRDYAATGVDFISSGALIHQATSVDLSLKAVFS